jgi:myo-inositol-1(or 4)-monophosphatase
MARSKAPAKGQKKPARAKAATKKAVAKKAPPKKAAAKKAPPKKAALKKAVPKKTSVKKADPKNKAAIKKAPVKKVIPKKTPAKKAAAKKLAPSKAAPKKVAPKKVVTELVTAKKTPIRGRRKVLDRNVLIELAEAIKADVAPAIDASKGREVIGSATSGDATFQIDKIAEKALLGYLREVKLPVAYYSEDAGYTTFSSGQPENLLVIDPIDGTRAAKSGFEACVVSVASTRIIERPRMGDIDNALILELRGPRSFYAERGKGTRLYVNGQYKKPKLSKNADLELMAWSMTVPARPAELIFPTAAKLIDLTSLKGGFFACNSSSFSLTRLLTNQLDACVDLANRFLRDIREAVEDQFINAGRGAVLGIAPYDIAAALLIAQEAGCIVTDAYGESLEDVLLLDSSVSNHRSMIAAANKELHDKLLSFFDARIQQFERLLERRAALTAGKKG